MLMHDLHKILWAVFAALLMGELAEHFGLRAAYAVLVVAALGFLGAAWVLARRQA